MPTEITERLSRLLHDNGGAPFLFIGSGFSRRYVGLEPWKDLLEAFCTEISDFGYYYSQSNQNLPRTASKMAEDFNEKWWQVERYTGSREEFSSSITGISSSLKYEISQHVKNLSHTTPDDEKIKEELRALSQLNVDGIITTNWDLLLEELFPDYRVFVGQEELLFSNPQSIAEIYKIHGCSTNPNSLVLTEEDYNRFEANNPYLAAKLITLFIEHPIIFIGYSISDPHIQKIIGSIVNCLGQEKLDQFGRNLIFIQRNSEEQEPSFQESLMAIGDTRIAITVINTDDFLDIYKAIDSTKRKIPARILRYCKEQMYELVKSSSPEAKLVVTDIDQIDDKDDVEFVMGVGVAQPEATIANTGYKGVSITDIFVDLIQDRDQYESHRLLNDTYPELVKKPNRYIPIYKHLRACNINSRADLLASDHHALISILDKATREDLKSSNYLSSYNREFRGKTLEEIIGNSTAEKAAINIPFLADKDINPESLRDFLKQHEHETHPGTNYGTYFRKLTCLLDRLEVWFRMINYTLGE